MWSTLTDQDSPLLVTVKYRKGNERHSKTRGRSRLAPPPLDTSVRTADSLVAAEVGHALVQARAADAPERQGDELSMNPPHGGALLCWQRVFGGQMLGREEAHQHCPDRCSWWCVQCRIG